MFLKETYKVQIVFVLLFGLILVLNWFNILTRHTAVILASIFFFLWIIFVIAVVVKKTKRR